VTNVLYNSYVNAKGIKHSVDDWEKKKDHPVVYIKWTNAMEYCRWLNSLLKAELPTGLVLRLPTEAEWEKAARGTDGREYPWGNEFDKNKCNSPGGRKGSTTPVGLYSPRGDSPYGCADMAGNVWEWTHSLKKDYLYNSIDGREDENASGRRVLRGGSFYDHEWYARCACRGGGSFVYFYYYVGLRVVAAPKLPQ
jgi:formylglycine-generating enzyme required for sulfatase activity